MFYYFGENCYILSIVRLCYRYLLNQSIFGNNKIIISTSDDHDSFYDFFPSIEINIPQENDIISTTTDISDTLSSLCISKPVSYQPYNNDNTLFPVSEKTQIILAACFGSIDGCSLEKEPCSSLSWDSRPNCNMLKRR